MQTHSSRGFNWSNFGASGKQVQGVASCWLANVRTVSSSVPSDLIQSLHLALSAITVFFEFQGSGVFCVFISCHSDDLL